MPPLVQRLCVRAMPLPHNKRYRPYETAHVAVFIREEDQELGLQRMHEVLARERWMLLEHQIHDRLIPERVAQESAEVRRGYDHALRHGDFFMVFPDHFGAGHKKEPGPTAPRLTEAFMDQVIKAAGGDRYNPDGPEHARPRNADYRIDDVLVELKDIAENALTKPTRQKRLAELTRRSGCQQPAVPLDLALVKRPEDRREFLNIIGEPINKALSEAADQVRKTRESIGDTSLRGGVILINSGTHFYGHELFVELARRSAARPGRNIDELFCFTSAMHTNGFDHRVDFTTFPANPTTALQRRILEAFWDKTHDLMTEWVRRGMVNDGVSLPPSEPLGFDDGGQTFFWLPEKIPSSLGLD